MLSRMMNRVDGVAAGLAVPDRTPSPTGSSRPTTGASSSSSVKTFASGDEASDVAPNKPDQFLWKLWFLVNPKIGDKDYADVIHWSRSGRYLIVPSEDVLGEKVCRVIFNQSHVTSFNKQMANWGFHRESKRGALLFLLDATLEEEKCLQGMTTGQTKVWYHDSLVEGSTNADVNAVVRKKGDTSDVRAARAAAGVLAKASAGSYGSLHSRRPDRSDSGSAKSASPELPAFSPAWSAARLTYTTAVPSSLNVRRHTSHVVERPKAQKPTLSVATSPSELSAARIYRFPTMLSRQMADSTRPVSAVSDLTASSSSSDDANGFRSAYGDSPASTRPSTGRSDYHSTLDAAGLPSIRTLGLLDVGQHHQQPQQMPMQTYHHVARPTYWSPQTHHARYMHPYYDWPIGYAAARMNSCAGPW